MSLEWAVLSTDRFVQIYPRDASLIVSKLDLHPDRDPNQRTPEASSDRLEILEAGTGMGGLTLHLARANDVDSSFEF